MRRFSFALFAAVILNVVIGVASVLAVGPNGPVPCCH